MDQGSLQDEIQKREPFEVIEQEVSLNLARTLDRLAAALQGVGNQLDTVQRPSHPPRERRADVLLRDQ